jgi:hypothetical protein
MEWVQLGLKHLLDHGETEPEKSLKKRMAFAPRSSISALSKGILTVALTSALIADIAGEILLYKSLTGRVDPRGDYYFYAFIVFESVISLAILFKSDSVIRAEERESQSE